MQNVYPCNDMRSVLFLVNKTINIINYLLFYLSKLYININISYDDNYWENQ